MLRLAVPAAYPNIHAVLPEMLQRNADEEFAYGLDALLAGLRMRQTNDSA